MGNTLRIGSQGFLAAFVQIVKILKTSQQTKVINLLNSVAEILVWGSQKWPLLTTYQISYRDATVF